MKIGPEPIAHTVTCAAGSILIFFLIGFLSLTAKAADHGPLSVADMSSPRATLRSFLETTDDIYIRWAALLKTFRDTDRLFPTPEERERQLNILRMAPAAIRALDVSKISPVLQDTIAPERMLQLREIFDRIALPALADVPDQAAMAERTPKRWRMPDTQIDFVRIEDGPRAGDYLISAETVDRLPEFYERVMNLPYKPGPAQDVQDGFRALAPGHPYTIYAFFLSSPVGLSYIIPVRWMLNWPNWTRAHFADATVWQWLGVGVGLCAGALIIFLTFRIAFRLERRNEGHSGPDWSSLPIPLGILFVAGVLIPFVVAFLRIGGILRVVIAFIQTGALSLTFAWLAIVGSVIIGELIVGAEHLTLRSLDGQLIRLGTRLVGVVVAVGCLIQGADNLGFPAYSVLAGLGVGGLAVALAARDSIANLLGSMLIMFEKPFRVGHVVRVAGAEGSVEDVGFRSTRIRTLDNSLISIPNNSVVNTTIENLSLRPMRRQRFVLGVTYDTPREKIEAMIVGIKQVIINHRLTDKSNLQVHFNAFSESSLDILVLFHLAVTDYSSELLAREEILLQIIDVAETIGVSFAFPTRTLHVDTASSGAMAEARDTRPWPAA